MKKITGLMLLACFIIGTGAVIARTSNNNVKKTVTGDHERMAKDNDPKAISAVEKAGIIPNDTVAGNASTPWYHPKTKRNLNVQEVFAGLGCGFTRGMGGANAPFGEGVSINAHYGTTLLNKYLLLEFNNNAHFMFAPNTEWFSKAFSLPQSQIKGVGMGFYEEFEMGFHVVVGGTRKVTLTAGPVAGGRLTIMPTMHLDKKLYYAAAPIAFCYGLKTNLFIGNKLYVYAQYTNTTIKNLVGQSSQSEPDNVRSGTQVSTDFGLLHVGMGYVFKCWW